MKIPVKQVLPDELLYLVFDTVKQLAEKPLEYVSVTYKEQDEEVHCRTLRAGLYDRAPFTKQQKEISDDDFNEG